MTSFKAKNPAFKERVLKKLEGQSFMRHIGFEITAIEEGMVEGEMPLLEIHKQQFGILHGGVVTTIADIVAGFAAYTLAPADKDVVTGEIKISCYRPGRGNRVRAVGRVQKPGKMISFVEAEVYAGDENGETLIAKASTTMILIDPMQ